MANHIGTRARIEPTIVAFAAISGSLLGTTAAFAQEPAKLIVDVGRCAVLQSPEERFACYEAAVDAAKKQSQAATAQGPAANGAPPPTQPTARAVEEAPAPAARNGAAAQDASTDARAERRSEQEFEEFSSTVAALRETVPNAFLITLDNGQVWRQVQPKPYPLRTGQKVRLYSSGWRGSRLEADGARGFIQVDRVK